MPVIRDGSNRVTEYTTAAPANPPGPVERVVEPSVIRRQAEERRNGATLAESRARGAIAAGFVKGAVKPADAPVADSPAKKRFGPAPGFKRSPETRERMRQAQLARYERLRIDRGVPAAEVRREIPAQSAEAGEPVAAVDQAMTVEGEDRCSFVRVITPSGIVHLCDRPADHDGAHRGRLLSIRVTDQVVSLLGYTVAVGQ